MKKTTTTYQQPIMNEIIEQFQNLLRVAERFKYTDVEPLDQLPRMDENINIFDCMLQFNRLKKLYRSLNTQFFEMAALFFK